MRVCIERIRKNVSEKNEKELAVVGNIQRHSNEKPDNESNEEERAEER